MVRSLLAFVFLAAVSVSAQAQVVDVSTGPEGPALDTFANFIEATDAGLFVSGGPFQTPGGSRAGAVMRWGSPGWASVGDLDIGDTAFASGPDGSLYVGGWFDFNGADNLIRWDGETWHSVGFDGNVSAEDISVGADGAVVVIAYDGGPEAYTVRRRVGEVWQTLGEALPSSAYDVATGAQGEVYVGGSFGVMRWSGTTWVSLGPGFDGPVVAVAVTDGELLAGGSFTSAGTAGTASVARWDGAAWVAAGEGLPSDVLSLRATDDGGALAVVRSRVDTPASVARWDGSAWTLHDMPANSRPSAAVEAADGRIYAVGSFSGLGGVVISAVLALSDDGWSPLGTEVNASVQSITRGASGQPVIAGQFDTAGETPARRVAERTANGWRALGDGLPSPQYPVVVASDGGTIYAGGRYTLPGGGSQAVFAWDGTHWAPLGPPDAYTAEALAVVDGALFRGGRYADAPQGDGSIVTERWTGTAWSQVGDAFDGRIRTLAQAPDGELCAGGSFTEVGGTRTGRATCFADGAWRALGAPLDQRSGQGETVFTIAFDADGTPYVGGIAVDGQGSGLVAWTGGGWVPVGSVPPIVVLALAPRPEGGVYAAATFEESAGLALWDGATWEIVGESLGSQTDIYALWLDDAGSVWAGGGFQVIGGVHSPHVIRYDPAGTTAGTAASPSPEPLALRLAPNPASGTVRLRAATPVGPVEVAVFEALGRRVALAFDGESAGRLDVALGLGGLAPGVYVVRLRTAEGVASERLVVTR